MFSLQRTVRVRDHIRPNWVSVDRDHRKRWMCSYYQPAVGQPHPNAGPLQTFESFAGGLTPDERLK